VDCWTKTQAFMAIVARYVTNDWELGTSGMSAAFAVHLLTALSTEETLLDLKEVPGKHSGENLADAIWDTLEQYGLLGKVRKAFWTVGFLSSLR
jgi:hypothetical protein